MMLYIEVCGCSGAGHDCTDDRCPDCLFLYFLFAAVFAEFSEMILRKLFAADRTIIIFHDVFPPG
jgi:hypothetical protein